MYLLLIRHGKSSTVPKAPEEGPLSEEGVIQATLTGEALRGQGIERLFSSPYPRAMQTALIISRKIGLPVEIRHRLHEKTGPGDRETKSQIAAKFPQFLIPDDMPEVWWPDVNETWEDVYERIRPVALEFKSLEGKHQRIAAVAHGGSLDALVSILADCPPRSKDRFYHHNCCFTLVSINGGVGRIHYLNQVSHLGPREIFF